MTAATATRDQLIQADIARQMATGAPQRAAAGPSATAQQQAAAGIVPGQAYTGHIENGRLVLTPVTGQTRRGDQTTTPAAPATGAAAATDVAGRAAAYASIVNALRANGLDEIIPMLDDWQIDNLSDAEIQAMLYDPASQPGKVVDRLYPELRLLREQGQPPKSIGDIQTLRGQYHDIFRAHDVPSGFYDQPSDFTDFIVKGKSPNELNADLQEWRAVADEAAAHPDNATTLTELNHLYGITPDSGAFLAYVIDPARGLDTIHRQVQAGTLSATAARTGFGGLQLSEAEQLAARGVDTGQAAGTFAELQRSSQLTQGIVGHTGDTLTRAEQLAAGFDANAVERAKLERIRGQRAAEFTGGGRTASGRDGTGLRPA